jgi:hypothetical protein
MGNSKNNPDKDWDYDFLSRNLFLDDKNSMRYKNLEKEIKIKEKERILNILKKEITDISNISRYLIPIIKDYIL